MWLMQVYRVGQNMVQRESKCLRTMDRYKKDKKGMKDEKEGCMRNEKKEKNFQDRAK